jgi:murein DD-endopeptidase MepM/ murein hydrolase activator NlpD
VRRLLAVVVFLLVAGVMAPAAAQNVLLEELKEIAREIEALEDAIEAAQTQESEFAVQIAQARARLASIEEELFRSELALSDLEGSILDTQGAVDFTQSEIIDKERDLSDTHAAIADMHDLVVSQAVELFKTGGAIVSSPLGFENAQQATVAVKYGEALLAQTNQNLEELDVLRIQAEEQILLIQDQRAELNQQLDKLEDAKYQAQIQAAIVSEKKNQAEGELVNQRALLQIVQTEIRFIEEELEAYEAEEGKLIELLAQAQKKGGLAPDELWPPLDGPVVSPFGQRRHPILGYTRLHAGIDIDGPPGAAIGAAASGDVIYAGWRGGYGNAVIIDHGGGMATLYAHQSNLAVSNGDEVLLGDVVGYVGSTGLSTGPHLHFEVRIDGKPVDPMQYFG